MRKFTLLGVAAFMAIGSFASPLKPVTHHKSNKLFSEPASTTEQKRITRMAGSAVMESPLHAQRKGKMAKKIKSTRQAPTPLEGEIIFEQPAGELSNWSRDCIGWYGFFGYVGNEQVTGGVQQMVEGEDGKLYLNILFSQFPLGDVWVYANKNDDGGFVIPGGQKVYSEEYDGEIMDCYLVPMTFAYDEEEEDYVFNYTEDITFNYVDGRYEQADPDLIVALCENDDYTEGEYEWTGYGDQQIVFTPMTATLAELPADVEAEKWAAITPDGGYFVDVAIKDSDIYIKGFVYGNEDGVVVGTIDGDEVTFKGGQFIGIDDYYWTWAYVYGGTVSEEWNEEWEMFDVIATVTGDIHFSYDAAAKKLVAKEAVLMAGNVSDNYDEVVATSYIDNLTIEKQNRNPQALPANPYDLEFWDEMEDWGTNSFLFKIPEMDVDGNLLDSENLYYRVYVDGDIFTFYDDEYPGLPEDGVEMLNCNFTNFSDIWSSGVSKNLTLYFEGMDSLGVQSVYMQPVEGGEPVELVSEIVTVDTSSVKEIVSNQVVSSVWFDLQGRRLSNPSNGMYIRVDKMTDGSRKAVKEVVK